jgi:protein-disulfide isomerase
MGTWPRAIIGRLFALVALAVSAALLAGSFRPGTPLCPFRGSGCSAVLSSSLGRPLGIPLPVVGLAVFAAYLALSLTPRARWAARIVGLAAGVGGLALLVLQASVLGQVCPLCVIVDVSALVVAACEIAGWPQSLAAVTGRGRALWLGGAAAALALGLTAGALASRNQKDQPLPPQVALYLNQSPGKVTIVEVADFQCPHCRLVHARLKQVLDSYGDRVRLVRLTAPMPKHAQARNASRAFLCAAKQNRGEEMADRLFQADDLSAEACAKLADSIGLSSAAFRACVADPAIDQRLDDDLAWVKAACPGGLPAIWVQDRLLDPNDLLNPEAVRAAVREAEERLARPSP